MPHEWFRVGVGRGEEAVYGSNELWNALETVTPHPLFGQFSKPPLNQVQPGRTGGGEMEREPRMFLQPSLHTGLLVSPIVIDDEVQQHLSGEFPIQPSQEAQEFLMAVLSHAFPNHPAIEHVEGSEQGRSAMPFVIVCHRATPALFHGQARLGPLQRLNLAFLIDAQDYCLVGRVVRYSPTTSVSFSVKCRSFESLKRSVR